MSPIGGHGHGFLTSVVNGTVMGVTDASNAKADAEAKARTLKFFAERLLERAGSLAFRFGGWRAPGGLSGVAGRAPCQCP